MHSQHRIVVACLHPVTLPHVLRALSTNSRHTVYVRLGSRTLLDMYTLLYCTVTLSFYHNISLTQQDSQLSRVTTRAHTEEGYVFGILVC